MQRTLLSLAFIATASVSYAQTMQTNEPRDPYGRPMIGRNDYVRQPGDQPGPVGAGNSANINGGNAAMISRTRVGQGYGGNDVATAPSTNKLSRDHAMGPEPMPAQTGPRQATYKDEYGFRYDDQGNRLDARGNVISPHNPQR